MHLGVGRTKTNDTSNVGGNHCNLKLRMAVRCGRPEHMWKTQRPIQQRSQALEDQLETRVYPLFFKQEE